MKWPFRKKPQPIQYTPSTGKPIDVSLLGLKPNTTYYVRILPREEQTIIVVTDFKEEDRD